MRVLQTVEGFSVRGFERRRGVERQDKSPRVASSWRSSMGSDEKVPMLGYIWLIVLQVLRVFSRPIRESHGIGNQVRRGYRAISSSPWRQS